MYVAPSERIKEILAKNGNEKDLAYHNEIMRLAKELDMDPSAFKKRQISRVTVANTQYGEMLKKGMFTDRGRVFIKYGEPDSVVDSDDKSLGTIQKWYYNDVNKQFTFLHDQDTSTYRLYNYSDE